MRRYLALLPLVALPAAVPEAAPLGGTVTGTVAVFDKGKPLPTDAWVYLVPVLPKGKKREAPRPTYVTISQQNQTFVPNRVVIPVGSTVAFPNDEQINTEHNVFSPALFDLSRYGPKKSKSWQFPDPGDFDIYCDIHPQMTAKVKVIDSNLFAKASGGTFTIANVPAGTYKVIAWAPNSDEVKEGPVTVVDGSPTSTPPLKLQLGAEKTHKRLNGQPYCPGGYGKGVNCSK